MEMELTAFAREKGEKSETGETRGRRQRAEIRGQKTGWVIRELEN